MSITFDELAAALDGRTGIVDVPCRACGPFHNPLRKVLRIWRNEPGLARFYCARCGEKGWARAATGPLATSRPADSASHRRRQAEAHGAAERRRKLEVARHLWSKGAAAEGTPVERYLRTVRRYAGPIPGTLRFLAPSGPDRHPAMIGAFALPDDAQPGCLCEPPINTIAGVHLTLLRPDGNGKAGTSRDKLMIGRSAGLPIAVAPVNDLLGLAITEGIEDALSLHEATGLGVWAAGSAGRMPALADIVPAWIDCTTILTDPDAAGQGNSSRLATALRRRGLHVELLTLVAAQETAA